MSGNAKIHGCRSRIRVWRTAEARDSARFSTSTQELTTYVRGRPRLYTELLRAGTGLFALTPSITPSQFHNFVERLELDQYPGAQGIGYLARVKRDQRKSFTAAMQRQGLKDFNKQVGFLIYEPVYENDRTPTSVSQRREALSGFVYSQFRAADFIKAIMAVRNTNDIDLRLYDGPEPLAENLLYDTGAETGSTDRSTTPRFTTATELDVAGRIWTLTFASCPEFVSAASRASVYYTALGGLLMSFVFFGQLEQNCPSRND